MPWHGLVLEAAEQWGCPPWEIAGGSKLEWFMKWKYMESIRRKVDNG